MFTSPLSNMTEIVKAIPKWIGQTAILDCLDIEIDI